MKSKKVLNPDGSTKRIIIQNDSGSYCSYSPKQAAQLINVLKKQLWGGIPLTDGFR